MSSKTISIRSVPVQFPYSPYKLQEVFMERVIQALQEENDALLESPTGTGKTICLLAAALSWRDKLAVDHAGHGTSIPKIIYSSRTHSQLSKVIQELSSSSFKPRMTVLGSRQQLCIHPSVENARPASKNGVCRSLVNAKRCSHFEAVQGFVASNPHTHHVADIEDMVKVGKASNVCPYFLARERVKTAEVAFMPYNYLVDSSIRRHVAPELEGAVLIFDEAHNLDSVCADASSFELKEKDVSECVDVLRSWVPSTAGDMANVRDLTSILNDVLKQLEGVNVGEHPGSVLLMCLVRSDISTEAAELAIDVLENCSTALSSSNVSMGGLQSVMTMFRIAYGIPKLLKEGPGQVSQYYHLHVSAASAETGYSRVFHYWCFHPGITMRVLRSQHRIRSIILASGTLSPLDAMASELGLPFPVRLENPHVVTASQVWAGVVTVGPGMVKLNHSFANRTSSDYLRDLGQAIVNFSRIVPDGMLVFFPAYSALDACVSSWQENGDRSIWASILKHKRIIVEPRAANQCTLAIADFQEKIADGSKKGVVFFAVCRGKVAEGLDFADRNGRAVIVVGIPFPNVVDAKVEQKKRFLDTARKTNELLATGDAWYNQQALCAVNQAVGRVIRHRFDFGAMIFLDVRYEKMAADHARPFLSSWIRPHVKVFSEFGKATISLSRFFQKAPKVIDELKDAAMKEAAEFAKMNVAASESSKKRSAFAVRPEAASDVSGPVPSVQEVETERAKKVRNAQLFMASAKTSLSSEKFTQFQSTLRMYKAKEITVQRVMNDVLPLFVAVEDAAKKKELLVGFEEFLPESNRKEFQRLAQELMQKKEELQIVPSNLSVLMSTTPVAPAAVREDLDDIIRNRALAKTLEKTIEPIVFNPNPAAEPITISPDEVSSPAATAAGSGEGTPRGPLCPICRDSFKQPFSSACGHICCFNCWESWLTVKLECPVCKEKVRQKQLRKLYFH